MASSNTTQRSLLTRIMLALLEFVIVFGLIFAAVTALRTFVIEPFTIPSGSMEKTLQIGDCIFAEKISYRSGAPQAGDIVTFADPEVNGRTLIKRVIATAGQTVDLRDGKVYIDGVAQEEPYTRGLPSEPLNTARGVEISYPYTIPEGSLWVMGDNRTNSADSRYFGAIPISSVSGHAIAIYWPINHMSALN